MKQFRWSGLLVFIAILFVCATIFYSTYVSSKIANTERKYVREWIEAQKTILSSKDSSNLNLATQISADNEDIPIIETNEQGKASQVSFDWKQAAAFQMGNYKIEIYNNGFKIGEGVTSLKKGGLF